MKKSTSIISQRSSLHALTRIVIIAIISAGLISIPGYFTAASATTNQVSTGDTQKYRVYEGLAPTMQSWENGMRTNPMPGTFEWWYLQGTFADGSRAQIVYQTKPWMDNNGPLQPYIIISIQTPNGTLLQDQVKVDAHQFNAARNTLNVTMANNWLRGDLNTIKLHVATTRNGIGADLVFTSAAPPTRFGGSGIWYFDPSLTRISAMNDAMPYAIVNGNLTYDGKPHPVQGTGYHDQQWGTVNWNQDYDGWYWSTGHYGNYTVDMFSFDMPTSSAFNNQQTQAFYLAKGNGPSKVLVETMEGITAHASGGNITAPGGVHTYPKILTLQWKNGSDSATLTLTNPKILVAVSPVVNTNATINGDPQYIRLNGTGTLNVNWTGSNETASAPAIWEVIYTH